MNGSQSGKRKRIQVKIESPQSSPSKSDFTRTRRSQMPTYFLIYLEKQDFSFCVPIEAILWRITLEAIAINMSVLEE